MNKEFQKTKKFRCRLGFHSWKVIGHRDRTWVDVDSHDGGVIDWELVECSLCGTIKQRAQRCK